MVQSINWSEVPFAQQQRLRFIESALIWEGSIQRKRVCDVFKVNANHVTKDYHLYKSYFPKALEYNPSSRAYEPGIKFKPVLAKEDPAEYLALLLAYAHSESDSMLPVLGADALRVEIIPTPSVSLNSEILRLVLQATRHRKGLEITYQSMSSAKSKERIVWPQALIYTGTQWHVRAFDSTHEQFRNFAITRIAEAQPTSVIRDVRSDLDTAWHAFERAEVVPHPKLNEHQKAVVAHEYGMRRQAGQWIWTVDIRQCLVGYFAVNYRLDLPGDNPLRDRIVLRNKKALSKYFFADAG
jgi:hypothetical protein